MNKFKLGSIGVFLISGILLIIFLLLIISYFYYRNEMVKNNIVALDDLSLLTATWTTFEDDQLGLSFKYPNNWGKLDVKESVGLNYAPRAFGVPEELSNILGENTPLMDFTKFSAMSEAEQLEFLKSNGEVYDQFLNRELRINFPQNNQIEIVLVNHGYIDYSDYEAGFSSSFQAYKGSLPMDSKRCIGRYRLSEPYIKIDNEAECIVLPNKMMKISGTIFTGENKETASVIGIGNLIFGKSKGYSGLLVNYLNYKIFDNAGKKVGEILGTHTSSGAASNRYYGDKYNPFINRVIDTKFIEDFMRELDARLNLVEGLDGKFSSMIKQKYREALLKHEGKLFLDHRDDNNFSLHQLENYEQEDIKNLIRSVDDLEKNYSKLAGIDLIYAISLLQSNKISETFRYDLKTNQDLVEFQNFLESFKIW